MDLDLAGRIGLVCAEAFLGEGARVALCSRSEENLSTAARALAARGHQVLTVVADLAQRGTAAATVATVEGALGPIDVLVCSAGAARRTSPDRLDEAAWHAGMDAKFFATVHAIQAA